MHTSKGTSLATWIFSSLFVVLLSCYLVKVEAFDLVGGDAAFLSDLRRVWPELNDPPFAWNGNVEKACEASWFNLTCCYIDTDAFIQNLTVAVLQEGFLPASIFTTNFTYIQELRIVAPLNTSLSSNATGAQTKLLQMNKMRTLQITNTRGPLPEPEQFAPWLQGMPHIVELRFTGWNFTGQDFGLLPNASTLKILDLSECEFSPGNPATQPPSPSLEQLYLQNNDLVGEIPFAIFNSNNLKRLYLASNRLSKIDPQIAGSFIEFLDISHNNFRNLTAELINCSKLTTLDVSYNQLSGDFAALPLPPAIKNLYLQGNLRLSGNAEIAFQRYDLNQCKIEDGPDVYCPDSLPVCCGLDGPLITSSTSATSIAASTTSSSTSSPLITSSTSSSTTSSTSSCSRFSCECSSNLAGISGSTCTGGIWTINGTANNTGTVTVGQQDIVIINGSLNQAPQATLEVYVGGQLQVEGPVSLAGTLIVFVTSSSTNGSVLVLNATNIQGRFDTIQVQQEYSGKKCHSVKADASYTSTSVSVLIIQTKLGSCSNSNAKTIGIAVGASVGALVILVVLIVIILVLLKKHGKLNILWWSRPEGTHNRSRLGTVGPQAHSSVHLNRL